MSYSVVLSAHLLGALMTAGAMAYATYAVWTGASWRYRRAAKILGALAAFEVLSGTMLSLLSASVSAASVCERLGFYLGVVAAIEAVLFIRMRSVSIPLPFRDVLSPVAATLFALAAAFIAGF